MFVFLNLFLSTVFVPLDLSFQKIKFASQGLSQSTYCNQIRLVRIISVVYFSAIEMCGAINL